MPSWNSAVGNYIILTRPCMHGAPSYEKIAVMLAKTLQKTLQGITVSLEKATLSLMPKKLWRKNVIFVGPLTEPSMRRVLIPSLFARKTVLYCTIEGPPLLYWLKPLMKTLSKNIFQVVTPSNFVREELEMTGIKVSAVIPHAVDFDEMEKLSARTQKVETSWSNRISEAKDSGKTVLLSVISFSSPRKGLSYYLRSLEQLKQLEDNFLAVLKIPQRPLKIPSRLSNYLLSVEGILSEVELYKLYSLSDVIVFPSLSEGFGLPIIEAFSVGKPVITLDAPPMNEINTEGTGYLVKTKKEFVAKNAEGDWTALVRYRVPDMKDFVEKLRESIEDVNERKSKALRAFSEAKKYDCNNLYRKFSWLLV